MTTRMISKKVLIADNEHNNVSTPIALEIPIDQYIEMLSSNLTILQNKETEPNQARGDGRL